MGLIYRNLLPLFLVAVILAIGSGVFLARSWNDDLAKNRLLDLKQIESSQLLLPGGTSALQACCDFSTSVVPVAGASDNAAARFEVRYSDPLVKGSHRSEIRLRPNPLRRDLWFQARLMLPGDWPPADERVIVMQWHGSRDFFLGEPGRVPPLELAAEGGEWRLITSWDSRRRTPDDDDDEVEGREEIWTAPLEPGEWETLTFHIVWSYEDDGLIQLWRNGEFVVDRRGPNAHNDLFGPYLKFGAYVPDWKRLPAEPPVAVRQVFFDEVSASSVAPESIERVQMK